MLHPLTRRDDTIDIHHGVSVPDPYRWLEDPDAPDVVEWVKRQNQLTDAFLADVPARERIRARLTALLDYKRNGAPIRLGGAYFYFHNDGLQPHPVLYRADNLHPAGSGRAGQGADAGPAALGDGPQVALDPNTFSADGTVGLQSWAVSRDGRWLAYGVTEGGSDWTILRVRDLSTGADLPDQVRWVKFCSPAFLPDSSGFLYSRFPEPAAGAQANRHHQVWLHRIGTSQEADTLVYERPDQPEWVMNAGFSDDGQFLVLYTSSAASAVNALWFAEVGPDGIGPVRPLRIDYDAEYSFIGNVGRTFLVRCDLDRPRGRVVAFDVDHPHVDSWRDIVPESEDKLLGCSRVGDRLFCEYLHHANSRVQVRDLEGRLVAELALPGPGTTSGFAGRQDEAETFFTFTSFTHPTTVYRVGLDTLAPELLFAPVVPFAVDDLHTEQIFVTSGDGTRVPAFVCWKGELVRDGARPTLLYGYGGFDIPLTPQFSTMLIGWLELGGVYVVANLRGGGEYGREWHDAGRRERKQNVFDDFVAVAEHLVATRVTSPAKLGIWGHSNGGLLVGAVLTQRPDLFGAAVPAVGVHDLLRYQHWTIGWAWADEYGTAEDPDLFPVLLKYSPLHNTRPASYPPTLIMTADHDDRVVPAHSFKFGAALQHAQQGAAPILLRIEERAGHGAAKPLTKVIDEYTDLWSFLVAALGVPTTG